MRCGGGGIKSNGESGCAKEARPGRKRCVSCNAAVRRWQDANKEHVAETFRNAYLKRRFGITAAAYDQMFVEQGGVCRICGRPESTLGKGGKVKRLAVDHDHSTGRVRALLCDKCNRALGLLGEDPEVIRIAAEYVEEYGKGVTF